ncbi:MAG: permease-like cell division protein FtsX, partial [bacterium]
MMFNRFTYYLREGIESVFNHGFMSFASICIIVACLLMMGSFSLLTLNVDSIIGRLEDENEILAYVDDALSEPDARALQPRIEAIPNVTSAVFVSRDEAWESFTSSYQNSSLFNGLTSDVLPHRYVIYLEDISRMAETQQAVYQLGGISQVNAHLEISEGFVRVRTL